MRRYRDAIYGGETVVLENQHLRLEMHRRPTGWGWGELSLLGKDGEPKFLAVLEHLGEAHWDQQSRPLRLEGRDYRLEKTGFGQRLTFEVQAQEVEPAERFDPEKPPFRGTVTLALPDDEARIRYEADIELRVPVSLRSLRGLWLRVGADGFGAARQDAIFPGIDWVTGDEWSSGTDYLEHPFALRVAPHPYKVSIPLMAISHDGVGIGVSWTPDLAVMPHRTHIRCPQPVFATPNSVDRRNHHLLGLMWPSVRHGLQQNALQADPPVRVPKGARFALDAQISVVKGTSLDVVLDWVELHGLPDPGIPRYEWQDALDRIARAYNSNLWIQNRGWADWYYTFGGIGEGRPVVPRFVSYYTEHGHDRSLAEQLRSKADWCQAQKYQRPRQEGRYHWLANPLYLVLEQPERAREIGEGLLELQTAEGDFPYDPQGVHDGKRTGWTTLLRPLGQPGDTSLGLCAEAAAALLISGQRTGESRFLEAGRKTLDYAMRFERPEGGDWWETPLHSPNLLAAGAAGVAYGLGYQQFGDGRYLARARQWMRSVIPFTHLWQPADVPMLYNTKPCLNGTFFLHDWTSNHVQWEVLTVFDYSEQAGINWATVDPEVDWDRYQRGITVAALRWMIDHEDCEWMALCQYPERAGDGSLDTMFTDTFSPLTNTYDGGPLLPEYIAQNILILLKRAKPNE